MGALTKGRLTPARERTRLNIGLAAAAHLFQGALVVLDANGNIKPGVPAAGLRGIGRSQDEYDNSGGIAGAIAGNVELGVFQYANSAGVDQITQADIGRRCYVVDDQTVAKTDNGGTRSIAGEVADVDAQGVWVDFLVGQSKGKTYLVLRADDLVGADARIYGIPSPVAGKITNILATLERHAIVTADCTLTGKIGAAAITTGVLTFPVAGSAVGAEISAQPTAANSVNPGDRINFMIGGGNTDATAFAQLVIEITQ